MKTVRNFASIFNSSHLRHALSLKGSNISM